MASLSTALDLLRSGICDKPMAERRWPYVALYRALINDKYVGQIISSLAEQMSFFQPKDAAVNVVGNLEQDLNSISDELPGPAVDALAEALGQLRRRATALAAVAVAKRPVLRWERSRFETEREHERERARKIYEELTNGKLNADELLPRISRLICHQAADRQNFDSLRTLYLFLSDGPGMIKGIISSMMMERNDYILSRGEPMVVNAIKRMFPPKGTIPAMDELRRNLPRIVSNVWHRQEGGYGHSLLRWGRP
ncbi:MAG: hypothetical protein ACYCOU_05895 [Sulfobacillus sp.]